MMAGNENSGMENWYRRIIDMAQEGVWQMDENFKTTFVNRRLADMFGYSVEEMMGRPVTDFMFPEDIPDHEEKMKERRMNVSGKYERRFRHKNGSAVWCIVSATPVGEASGGAFKGSFAMITDISYRKQAENALRQREALLASVFTAAPLGICVMKERVYQSVNKYWCEHFGYAESEMIGNTTRMLYDSEEEYERVGRELYTRLKQENVSSVRTRLRHKDGTVRDAFLTAAPLRANAPEEGVVVIIEDITERMRARDAFLKSEAMFKGIASASPVGLGLVHDRHIEWVNDTLLGIVGRQKDEILGRDARIFYEDDRSYQLFASQFYMQVAEKGRAELEVQWLHKNGSIINILLTGVSVQHDSHASSVLFAALNITAHKHAEAALQVSQRRLMDIIEFLPDATFVIDQNGVVTAWNKAIEEMTGVKAVDIIGKGNHEYAIPFYGERRPILIDLVLHPNEDIEKKYSMVRRDARGLIFADVFVPGTYQGKGAYLSGKAQVIRDASGAIVGAIESIRDVTEQKRMEKSLNASLREELKSREIMTSMLEDNNRIREELENKLRELKQAEAMLVQSAKLASLGRLVADMAHEVNNPLMIISGSAQLALMSESLDEELKNNLQVIHNECNRAKSIIQRLLKFSRPSKGEQKLFDVNQCVEVVVNLLGHQYELGNVRIAAHFAADLPQITADEKQLQEVFMNLLNNARDAMPEGGIIEVSTSRDGDRVRITIKDTGCGMDEGTLAKLFEPFFTTKEKGTGLGLAVCYGIIKAHNGEMKVSSELHKGTTVDVWLPAAP